MEIGRRRAAGWNWVEPQARERAAPTAKQRLAGVRHLFDWLVTGQVVPAIPAVSVRGPRHSARAGRAPALEPSEARLPDGIDATTHAGLRDRVLIGCMVYGLARVGAVLGMRMEDAYVQNGRLWPRLAERGGKAHAVPCHHRRRSSCKPT